MLDPHIEPSAVKHIPEQIQLIEKLIEKGNAYASEDGSVYFSVKSYVKRLHNTNFISKCAIIFLKRKSNLP